MVYVPSAVSDLSYNRFESCPDYLNKNKYMLTPIAVLLSDTVSKLQKVKSVDQWNAVREGAKRDLKDIVFRSDTRTLQQLNTLFTRMWLDHFVPTIDGSGLIVRVLGKDPIKDKKQK